MKLHPVEDDLLRKFAPAERDADSDPLGVLVVEDNKDQADLVRRILERQNFDVTIVGDGPSALEALALTPYSIVLLDYSLPRMNGLEVLAELRRRDSQVPVVIVTAQGDERLAIEAMKAGGMDFIVKTSRYFEALPTVLWKVLKQHELAVENQRLHRETQRRLREAEALVELSRVLTSTLKAETLMSRIGAAAARACDMERCTIFVYAGGRIRARIAQSADGRVDLDPWQALAGPEGGALDALPMVEQAIQRREAVVIANPGGDPLCPTLSPLFRPKAVLVLPLISRDVVTGALLLERAEPLASPQVILGTTVASHVALALDNSQLYEETQRTLADLKQTQEHLVRGETLRALGELASGAAHHLNNLLAVISARTQMLLRSSDLEPQRRPLEIIERATRDGAEVVRRIQEFARTQQMDERKPVDLSQVALDVVEMTRVRWRDAAIAQGLAIDVDCELSSIPPVSGHAAALREVVTNLMLNAVDALPRGGRIKVRTWADDKMAMLSVADNGVGMSDEVLRRALEPFFTTKGVKSTGLGLSVNFGILQRHGGDVTIASAEGKGTTVTIRLPVLLDNVEVASDPPPLRPEERFTILLVDDDVDVRESFADLLEAAQHTIIRAADGAEALARLQSGLSPDLVLTDLGMPGMTGWELAREIKSRWPGLPVGLVTGWGRDSWARPESDREVDFVVSKPLDTEKLRQAIAAARRADDGRPRIGRP